MQFRTRFSGAFGKNSPNIIAQLLDKSETASNWQSADRLATFGYLLQPAALSPRCWADETGQVCIVADARLWDAPQVRAELEKRGRHIQSQADTELLLGLYLEYGTDFVKHCRGMFVCAIYDARQHPARLILARDPLGGRGALYYAVNNGAIAFSSTLRSLRRWSAIKLEPEIEAVRDYLIYAFVPYEKTLIKGCYELPPGHILVVNERLEMTKTEYWRIYEQKWDNAASVETWSTPLRALLEDCVSERLPKGGPVAILLSGGLDSSAITALATRLHDAPIHTFSISFGEQYRNELPFSSMVAEHCRTNHHILSVSGQEIAENIEETHARMDSPTGDPLTVPNFLLDKAASPYSDIVLNGEGGDPCFGGPKNLAMTLHELYGDVGSGLPAHEQNYLRSYQKCYEDLPGLFTRSAQAELQKAPPMESKLTPYFNDPYVTDFLNRLQNINVRLKGSHQILFKVDRMTAAWGVEGRSPLFDRRVVDFSFGIPPHFKQMGNSEKFVLKKAVWDILPEPILTRPKSGMLVPVQGWFRQELREMAKEMLLGKRARQRDILNHDLLKSWLAYRENLFPRHGIKLWLVLSLELYFRAFLDAPRSAPVLLDPQRGL
jgi:asparagine synthase (glutamine-hydrolysing)